MADDPQGLWANLLSRQDNRIRAAWDSLTPDERAAVRAHLRRMASEPDWSEPQRRSAAAALAVLDDPPPNARS